MYAEALGVDPLLEKSAQWVTWADQEHFQAHNDQSALYNLQQFWNQHEQDARVYPDLMKDLTYLDALSHRVMGYILMQSMTVGDPRDLPALTQEMQQQFALSSQEFAAAGKTMEASHDAVRADQAQTDADQISENYVDDSYVTAFRDQYEKVLDATGSALKNAGNVLGFISNPVVLAGIAGLGLWWAFGRRK